MGARVIMQVAGGDLHGGEGGGREDGRDSVGGRAVMGYDPGMDTSVNFWRSLGHRIAASVGVTFVITGALAGCGAKVVVDEEGAGGTGAGGQTSSNGTTGPGPTSSSGTMTCGGTGQTQPFLACFKPGASVCPSKENAADLIAVTYDFGCTCDQSDMCFCLDAVNDGPKPDPSGSGLCCYDTMIELSCVI